MSRLRSLAFPLALAMILGGLSAWLAKISEITVEETQLDPSQPQYHIETMQAKRYDEQGLLKEQVIAKSAWQLPDQKNVFFNDAQFQVAQQGTWQYQINSKQAQYGLENKQVALKDDVLLLKYATASSPATQIRTNYLVIDTQAQTAQTQAPVQFTYGKSNGSANGLFYDHKNGKLDLPSNVKAMIYDFKTKN